MVWKPEYAAARKAKAAASPEYRAKRNAQSTKDKDARKIYMAQYYKDNPEKFPKRTPEKQATYNANRRQRYASDAEFREKVKAQAKVPAAVKRRALLSQYGLTPESFEQLLAAQGRKCAICGHAQPSPKMFPMIDHCHKSGKVRGILCSHCNMGLGKFKDDPKLLQAAIAYLLSRG